MPASNCVSVMVSAHLKCCCGQLACPCSPQGLQGKGMAVSTTKRISLKGPKPNEGSVEQYTAVTGALTDEAKCMGAESFT